MMNYKKKSGNKIMSAGNLNAKVPSFSESYDEGMKAIHKKRKQTY